jgi:ferredoxin-like protein FixX
MSRSCEDLPVLSPYSPKSDRKENQLCGSEGTPYGGMVVEYAGCLECGTCKIACTLKAIIWDYPKGEFGVQYRFG